MELHDGKDADQEDLVCEDGRRRERDGGESVVGGCRQRSPSSIGTKRTGRRFDVRSRPSRSFSTSTRFWMP